MQNLKYTSSLYQYSVPPVFSHLPGPSDPQQYKFIAYSFDTRISNISVQRRASNESAGSLGIFSYNRSLESAYGENAPTIQDGKIEAMFDKIDSTLNEINDEGRYQAMIQKQEVRNTQPISNSRTNYHPQTYQANYQNNSYQSTSKTHNVNTTIKNPINNTSFQYTSPVLSNTRYSTEPLSTSRQSHPLPSCETFNVPNHPTNNSFKYEASSFITKKLPPTDYDKDFTPSDILSKLRPENKNTIMRIKENFQNLRRGSIYTETKSYNSPSHLHEQRAASSFEKKPYQNVSFEKRVIEQNRPISYAPNIYTPEGGNYANSSLSSFYS